MAVDKGFSSDEKQIVTFVLGEEAFGLNIMNVQEIIRMPSITVIPQAPAYVEGITNLRGNILPVVDTRTRFNMERAEKKESNRVIVVDVGGRTVGLNVDAVSEVLRVDEGRIEPAPAMVAGEGASAITGMVKTEDGKKVVMILDASHLCRMESAGTQGAAGSGLRHEQARKTAEKKLEEVQLVTFRLGEEEFALEIEHVREIIRYPEIVKVPNVPDYIRGVISLRERLLPIIDLRLRLGTGEAEVTESTRVVVVEFEEAQIGLVVDRVFEVARIPRDTIFPPPRTFSGEGNDQLKGIARLDAGKRILMLIDSSRIISGEELEDLTRSESGAPEAAEASFTISQNLDEEQMVVFKLDGEQFGVRITQVQEINRLSRITKVPRAPKFVEGVVNLRGDVIPVIDLRKRFDMDPKEYTEFTRIIVSDINKRKIGIIVDEVLEVLRFSSALLEEAPEIILEGEAQRFMDGIINLNNRMIMSLDLENILVDKEWKKLDAIKGGDSKPSNTPRLKKQGKKGE